MRDKNPLSPEERTLYFDVQADFGITKHMGGLGATKELIELCRIDKDSYILEVGCGVGITACYLARKKEPQVVGIDISERMIEVAKERAKREGVEDRVEFKVADAQNLPFKDSLFDAVISESVIAFVEDKEKTLNEYLRVTKPGGFVGINEAFWMGKPPKELVEYISRILRAEFLTSDGWRQLLAGAGLKDLIVKTHKVKMRNEMVEQMRRFKAREYLRAWYRLSFGFLKSPIYRKFTKEAIVAPKSVLQFLKYVGYGIFVGRK